MACSIIENYENYTVCDTGEVFNNKTNKALKPLVNYKTGYCTVSLPRPGGGNAQSLYIHQLVAKYFMAKPESDQKLELDHKNNNKQDNSANNLQYVTRSENMRKTLDKTKTTSKYYGVQYDKNNGYWVAQLCSTTRTKAYIGTYRSEIEAAIAYNQEALKCGVSKVNQLN